MATGDELLIVDSVKAHREGMRTLFEDAGYVCTAVGTVADARERIERKFFPAALIDLDVERPGAGIDLVRFIHERSRPTGVVLLSGRRSFEGAVEAFRLGAVDVLLKRPGEVDHLRHIVDVAAERNRGAEAEGAQSVLREVHGILDDAFRVMLQMARRVYHDVSIGSGGRARPRVLVVDSDPAFLQEIAQFLGTKEWEIGAEMTGGAALDKASGQSFDVVAARDDLPDLKGSLVIKSIQTSRAETTGLLYSAPGGEGRIEVWEAGRPEDVERPFKGAGHLVQRIEQAVDRLGATQRDRRVIQAFRREHEDFLRRFAEIKTRIARMIE